MNFDGILKVGSTRHQDEPSRFKKSLNVPFCSRKSLIKDKINIIFFFLLKQVII